MKDEYKPINKVFVSTIAPFTIGAFVAIESDEKIAGSKGSHIIACFKSTNHYYEKEIWQADVKAAVEFGKLVAKQLGLRLKIVRRS